MTVKQFSWAETGKVFVIDDIEVESKHNIQIEAGDFFAFVLDNVLRVGKLLRTNIQTNSATFESFTFNYQYVQYGWPIYCEAIWCRMWISNDTVFSKNFVSDYLAHF